jgi:hypothetical protein
MTLQLRYFEANVLGSYLMDAWQNELQTEADPSGGKWFTSGPGNGQGLLGGLLDELRTDLVFEAGRMTVNKTREIAATTTLDNRAGNLANGATTTLNWTITNSATASHSATHSIRSGISERVKVEGKFGGIGVASETAITFDYSYSWTDTQGSTLTDTKSFSATVPLQVPAGKVQKLVVLADHDEVALPYSAQVYLTGVSEANFASQVNGKSRWTADAGTICEWIKKYGSAKGDAMEFEADAIDRTRGIALLRGTMRAKQSVNFTIYKLDVTSSFDGAPDSAVLLKQLQNGGGGAVQVKPVIHEGK